MAVYQECNNKNVNPKNTGAKEQCLVGVTTKYAFAPDKTFKFPTIADAKDIDKWNQAIANKDIIPLYDVEEYAIADTEATYFEGLRTRYETTPAKKVRTFRSILGLCSYSALFSYNKKEGQVFEFTEDGAIKAVSTTDGGIKGQNARIEVGELLDAVSGTPQSTVVTVNYTDPSEYKNNGAQLRPDGWSGSDIFGVFDITLDQVSATSTVIRFTATAGCAGGDELVDSFEAANVEVRNLSGALVTTTFVEADANGVYQVSGTGFASGFTVSLVGVVTAVDTSYESPEPLVIVVTP